MNDDCVFCAFIHGNEPRPPSYIEVGPGFVAFEPLNPAAPGHTLFVPTEHVRDATRSLEATTGAMAHAYVYARYLHLFGRSCNIFINVGSGAGQTVMHLHVHVLPRSADDGLKPPWAPLEA